MERNGSTTRAIGRPRSDPSPLSTAKIPAPARMPLSSRMLVPELPQSSTSAGSTNPSSPRPRTRTTLSSTSTAPPS